MTLEMSARGGQRRRWMMARQLGCVLIGALLSVAVPLTGARSQDDDITPELLELLLFDPVNDLDGDGIADGNDRDIDGDGVPNDRDLFPRNPFESADRDGDGIGDNGDPDRDGDGEENRFDGDPDDPDVSLVGSTPIAFQVTSNGALTYSVPIAVPPGSGGVVPPLSLSYSSERGNGLLGMGWGIGGLSFVTRCPAAIVPDGFFDPVDFDDNDRFCLDGERLIEVERSGTSVSYRTEIETFQKVTAVVDSTGNPTRFEVRLRNGQILDFGSTANARVAGGRGILLWGLSSVRDRSGNFARYTYLSQSDNKMLALSRIDYSGNDVVGVAAQNSVRFQYEARPAGDVRVTFGPAGRTRFDQRLKSVDTFAGSRPVVSYRLRYEESFATSRSRLSSITQCGFDARGAAACLPASTFSYSSDRFGIQSIVRVGSLGGSISDGRLFYGDANGDGRTDVVYQTPGNEYRVALGGEAGRTLGTFSRWLVPQNIGNFAQTNPTLGDLNGDGLQDLVVANTNGDLYSFLSNGSEFTSQRLVASYGPGAAFFQLNDLNGDGRDDLIFRRVDNRIFVQYSTGSSLEAAVQVHTVGVPGNSPDVQVDYPDVTGDGLPDVVYRDANNCVLVYPWIGTRFVAFGSNAACRIDLPGSVADTEIDFADFNGDGRDDLIYRTLSSNEYFVALSDGGRFLAAERVLDQAPTERIGPGQAKYPDLNGDGRADIAYRRETGRDPVSSEVLVRLSDGGGFRPIQTYLQKPERVILGQVAYPDLDGDGLQELVYRTEDNRLEQGLTKRRRPDLLTFVREGNGKETSVEYKTLSDPDVYDKGQGAVYPVVDFQAPFPVVSAMETTNGLLDGVGQPIRLRRTFVYSGMRMDLERGISLGFAQIDEFNPNRGIQMTSRYAQGFPLQGKETFVEMRSLQGQLRMRTATEYDTAPSFGGKVVRSFMASQQDETFELDGKAFASRMTRMEYDAFNNPTLVLSTSMDGFRKETITTFANDADSWLIGQILELRSIASFPNTEPVERRTTFEYEPERGLRTSEIVQPETSLELVSRFEYDVFGNVVSTTIEGADVPLRGEQTTYEPTGRFPTRFTNALGHETQQTVDARFGNPTSTTDPNGLRTSFRFDPVGRVIETAFADGSKGRTFRSFCDSEPSACAGVPGVLRVEEQVEGAPATATVLDLLGREVRASTQAFDGRWADSDTRYDSLGRVRARSAEYFSGDPVFWTQFEYDALDRTLKQTEPDGSVTRFAYAGLVTTTTNALDQTRRETRNSQDALVEVRDAIGGEQVFSYDGEGSLLRVGDPMGNETLATYDALGRQLTLDDPDLGLTLFTYDALGQLRTTSDANGDVERLDYDLLGRLLQRTEPGASVSFTYDSAANGVGALAAVAGNQEGTRYARSFSYDRFGRPSSQRVEIDGKSFVTSQTYDAFGRVERIRYPTNLEVRRQYNESGYLTAVRNPETNAAY